MNEFQVCLTTVCGLHGAQNGYECSPTQIINLFQTYNWGGGLMGINFIGDSVPPQCLKVRPSNRDPANTPCSISGDSTYGGDEYRLGVGR